MLSQVNGWLAQEYKPWAIVLFLQMTLPNHPIFAWKDRAQPRSECAARQAGENDKKEKLLWTALSECKSAAYVLSGFVELSRHCIFRPWTVWREGNWALLHPWWSESTHLSFPQCITTYTYQWITVFAKNTNRNPKAILAIIIGGSCPHHHHHQKKQQSF